MYAADYKNSIRGARSRASGQIFEQMVEAASIFYEQEGISVIHKTPEPMKVLSVFNRNAGQFICCFAKKAQPDFKGILMDSTMILFDAKHTDKDRIRRDVVTKEQEECFEKYMKMGAMCWIVVSLRFEKYYRVPWVVFRDMKKIFGHKYMNEKELETYEIRYSRGILRFLDGIRLKGGFDENREERAGTDSGQDEGNRTEERSDPGIIRGAGG